MQLYFFFPLYPLVAFNVFKIGNTYPGNVMHFKRILWNEGGGYNTDTGKFTAPVTGIYQFNAHICLKRDKDANYFIRAGNNYIITGEYRVPNAASSGKCTSFSAVGLLQKSETAYVGGIYFSYVYDNGFDDVNSFSGVLIRAV